MQINYQMRQGMVFNSLNISFCETMLTLQSKRHGSHLSTEPRSAVKTMRRHLITNEIDGHKLQGWVLRYT